DVFLRDRDADNDGIYDEAGAVTTTRISVGLAGAEANGDSGVGVTGSFGGNSLSISADGRYIAFSSEASNLVANDTNGTVDVFVYDRVAGTTQRVSVATGGGQAGAVSDQPSISADGRYIAFRSFATNLIGAGNDTNNRADIFVHDRVGNTTTRVSVATGNVQSDGHSFTPQISDSVDGRYVVFA
ncbi:MAG: PD40 domain-containing protein, partial [Anaerolineales bacterium]|nr:PD40 domain-containing protein [Anaerolineales bacterium]